MAGRETSWVTVVTGKTGEPGHVGGVHGEGEAVVAVHGA